MTDLAKTGGLFGACKRDLEAVDSLGASPDRYPLAPESPFRGREIRQLLHGKRRGVYRILYEIRGNTVHVLHVRDGAKQFLDEA